MFLGNKIRLLELTHRLCQHVPTWNGSCGFCLEIKKDYDRVFRVQQIKMHAGLGTHMDAPSHRFEGASSIADIPLENLIAPACVLNVSKKAGADYEISAQDIREYEKAYGIIKEKSLVIGYTGWDRYWNNVEKYRNVGPDQKMHFPAFSAEAAEILLERKVAGIAIDTLSPDCLDASFPVHKLILGQGKYIIENIAGCSSMPALGALVVALPLNMEDATEAPMRIVGIVPK